MKFHIKKTAVPLLVVLFVCILGYLVISISNSKQETEISQNYTDCVVGLLSDGNVGSNLVVYDTDSWVSSVLLELPDVTPDNYAAISSDRDYIAFTTWDQDYVRRYLKIYSARTQKFWYIYEDIPAKTEIIDISWMPDNETLLFVINDTGTLSYQEIRTINIKTQAESTLAKGEVWKVRTSGEGDSLSDDFYLKGEGKFISVQDKVRDNESDADKTSGWDYYLTQSNIDQIYQYYGGTGSFSRADIPNCFYVDFSRPRVSADGNSIIYSATLQRNSAMGEHTPLWICSAIWRYDCETQTSTIIYAQTDGGAIGRVDWLNDNQAAFIAYYDFQGSRDAVNIYTFDSNECSVLFPYTDDNYNNVTLLPIGAQKLTFTSSAKEAKYNESITIEYDLSTRKYRPIDIQLNQATVLLENFVYIRLISNSNIQ